MVTKPRHFVITETDLAFSGFVRQLKGGELDADHILSGDYGQWQPVAEALWQQYQEGYVYGGKRSAKDLASKALKSLCVHDHDLQTLVERVVSPGKSTSADIDKVLLSYDAAPPLPTDVTDFSNDVIERIAEARQFLDEYIAWSKVWSPRGPYIFHEACALWILSTLSLRRIYIPLGKGIWTQLYIMLAADSSKYAKSTTIENALITLRAAGLDWVLLPGKMTPEFFYKMASGRVSDEYETMTDDEIALYKKQLAFAGKYGWEYPEFGSQLASLMQTQSVMKQWMPILLYWDDMPTSDKNSTVGRGGEKVEMPFLSLLASLTLDDIARLPKTMNLYNNGFWPRFVPCTPKKEEWNLDHFPQGKITVPASIVKALQSFHESLGEPVIEDIRPQMNRQGRETGRYTVQKTKHPVHECTLGPGVYDAFVRYGDALGFMTVRDGIVPRELYTSYNRIAKRCMSIAALLSWMSDGGGRIELHHWAAAQQITERQRESLHEFHMQSVGQAINPAKETENLIVKHIKAGQEAKHPLRAYEIAQRIRNLDAKTVNDQLRNMVEAGLVTKWEMPGGKNGNRSTFVYTMFNSDAPEGAIIEEKKEGQGVG